jgi:hypothetical protein
MIITQIELPVVKRMVQEVIPATTMQNVTIETFDDYIRDGLVVRMVTKMLGSNKNYVTATAIASVDALDESNMNLIKLLLKKQFEEATIFTFMKKWGRNIKVRRYAVTKRGTELAEYYEKLCPHIAIPDNRVHFEWLTTGEENV